jgi:hypothetical protein
MNRCSRGRNQEMSNSSLIRWGGASLLIAGTANAIFWLLIIQIGTFAGATASLNPLWVPSQLLHTLAATLALLGLVGLYTWLGQKNGQLGLTGFVLALFGTGFYLADAILALVVFPLVATSAPSLIAADGALNMSPAYTVFAVTFMVGYILFGIALLRIGALPRGASPLLTVGAILTNLPPGLVPMLILIVGGVLWGIGAAWLGYTLWSGKEHGDAK